MLRFSLSHRHTLQFLCAGLFLCSTFATAPQAHAIVSFTRTNSATVNTGVVGTIKQVRVFPDGLLVMGSSRTAMMKVSTDGETAATVTASPTLPCTTLNSFIGTGSIANGFLYFTCSASANVPKYQITDTTATGTATGSIAGGGLSDIGILPDGKLLVNKGATLYTLDKDLNQLSFTSTTASISRLAVDASRNMYYVSSSRTLRKLNLDTLVDSLVRSAFTGTLPKGLYTTSDGTTYYADATGGIVKTTPAGTTLWTLPFSNLASIDLDTRGNLYAIDTTGAISVYAPISAPSSFTATATGSNMRLNWTTGISDSDFAGVTIRRSTASFPTLLTDGILVTSGNTGSTLLDTGLTDNTTYYYTVFNRTSDGYYSLATTATDSILDNTPPSAPVLSATVSGTTVSLSWTVPSTTDSFILRRSTTGYPATITSDTNVVPGLTSSDTSYVQSGMSDGTFYYSLFALDASGNASVAGTASVTVDTTGPSAPTLLATPSGTSVNLSWDVPSTTDSFVIRWSTVSAPANTAAGSLLANLTASDTSYSHTGLSDGTYYYSIFAKDALGNPSNAGTASATIATASSSSSSTSTETTHTPSVSHGGGRGRGTTTARSVTTAHPASPTTKPTQPTEPNKPTMNVVTRTCARVKSGFTGSAFTRVNERLLKRLGFGC